MSTRTPHLVGRLNVDENGGSGQRANLKLDCCWNLFPRRCTTSSVGGSVVGETEDCEAQSVLLNHVAKLVLSSVGPFEPPLVEKVPNKPPSRACVNICGFAFLKRHEYRARLCAITYIHIHKRPLPHAISRLQSH